MRVKKITKVGLDLDNTIIDYKHSYLEVAKILGISFVKKSKEEIKNFLIDKNNNDYEWQRFQSVLYTKGLAYATPSLGLLPFLKYCKEKKLNVFLISHKTEKGPADFGGQDLRKPALHWLEKNNIVPDLILSENVFFCDSQEMKIKKINELGCNIFVDDLEEILSHRNLNKSVKKILFSEISKKDSIHDFEELIKLMEKN